MSRSVFFGRRWIALLWLMCSAINFAQRPAHVLPTTNPPVTTAHHKYQTPAERLMIPFLKAHAGSSALKVAAARSMDATASVPAPNFGAYVNAPAYPGTTTFESAAGSPYSPYTVGATVEVTSDFNKDGKPDIAVIQENGTLNILFNDGKGALQAPVSYINPNYETSNIFSMYAVDVNGDGSPDIVAFDVATDSVLTWLNLGNGTFSPVVTTPLDNTYGVPSTIAVADVNGDGKADLIYIPLQQPAPTPQNSYLEVQLGAGDGTFGTASAAKIQKFSIAAGGFSVGALTLADLNGDGKLDLAVSLEENFTMTTGQYVVTTALGNGDGTFSPLDVVQPISLSETATGAEPALLYNSTGVHLVDVNGDGKLDIVSDVNGVIVTSLGSGTGAFSTAVTSIAAGVDNVYSSLVMDVNGDGKADFVEAGQTMGVYLGNGDGTFNPPITGAQWVIDPAGGDSLVAADFNGDGIADVAQLGSATWNVSLYFGTGKSLVGAPIVTAMNDPNGFDSYLAAGGNYTASGYMSPLFLYDNGQTSNIVTDVSDGKGNFTGVTALAGGIPSDLEFVQPIKADFNGDGLDDLIYATVAGDVKVALAKGDGTFATPVSVGLPAALCPVNYAAAGDINGDGKVDLVIPYGGDQICGASGSGVSGYYVALGHGDGTFATPVFTATGFELYSLTLADLNNDGDLDLILNDGDFTAINDFPAPAYGPAYTISVAMGAGDGTFAISNTILQNYVVTSVAAGDINHDGKTDLVLSAQEVLNTSLQTGGILLITGNGNGTFNPPSEIASDNYFSDVKLVDMNNDGNLDVVAALYSTPALLNGYSGMVTLLGYGDGAFAAPVSEFEGFDNTLPLVGHFVNDGAVDVMDNTGYGAALFVGQGGTTLTLSTSPSSIVFGQTVTLTATLKPALSSRPAAAGTISFYDGATLLDTAPVSSGTATYATSSLASGSHSIQVVYSGDANFNPNRSATSVVTVAALVPEFTLNSTPNTLSLTVGSQGIVTLNLAANSTFSGPVALTCSGMTSYGSCTVNPASLTLTAGGTGIATLVVDTVGTPTALQRTTNPWGGPTGAVSMAALVVIFFGRRKRLLLAASLALGFVLSTSLVLTGCGGGGKKPQPTVYTLTVTATPQSGSPANPQTANISVNVQ